MWWRGSAQHRAPAAVCQGGGRRGALPPCVVQRGRGAPGLPGEPGLPVRGQGLVLPPAGHQGEAGGGESGGGGRTAAEVAGGRAQAHRQVRVLLVFLHRETLLLLLSWLSVEERARLGRSVRYWAALESAVLGALDREGEGMLSYALAVKMMGTECSSLHASCREGAAWRCGVAGRLARRAGELGLLSSHCNSFTGSSLKAVTALFEELLEPQQLHLPPAGQGGGAGAVRGLSALPQD